MGKKLLFFAGSYFFTSALAKAFTPADFCIPCLWNLLFGVRCPGCGLTTAFVALVRLDFLAAYESNALIFILLPLGWYLVAVDFSRYSGSLGKPG
jgi:hypothetical protein